MDKQSIATDGAPAAIGPYSQAVACGDLVFCSGQIALDPGSGELVGTTAAEQTVQVMQNLGAVLAAADSSFEQVVHCTVYLVDMADYAAVNEVYAGSFSNDGPARAAVAVSGLPKDALVEVTCIAHR